MNMPNRTNETKTWMYLAHAAQFNKPGAYQSFDLAGFPVFLIRGKDDKIRAFHNVCRHRAYTITRKETGASTVLGCRYHGWSYDTTGRLVKAPQFDDMPGFDKSQNSLFEVHTHTTEHGFVLVNLNAEIPTHLCDEELSALNNFARNYTPQKSSLWIAGRTVPGDFNWKMASKCLCISRSGCTSNFSSAIFVPEILHPRVGKQGTSDLESFHYHESGKGDHGK